ncbi:uncharacterized protein LOC111288258 [Durio zibethinus]|uniref:Uncharacterized protein LOC111288258 n=1 Tax=Durio zibethinus TaxID=66656 RepID=A0A6P5Y2Z9_DURZI|nr:uncharacterized protein LOC111288258 [Durio zibethinus]
MGLSPNFLLKPPLVFHHFPLYKRTQHVISPANSIKTDQKISRKSPSLTFSRMSGAAGKAWIVAATLIGAVEALSDQGICKWNYTIRSLHQHAMNNVRSFTEANMISSPSSSFSAAVSNKLREEKRRKAEEKMRKVMDLNCWGPNSVRF